MLNSDSVSDEEMSIFNTCPQSKDVDRRDYVRDVIEVSRWSEEFDCHGMLIYADNGLVDPWLVAQIVVQNTRRMSPLVAVQPIYMHPYLLAKLIVSLPHLHVPPIPPHIVAPRL